MSELAPIPFVGLALAWDTPIVRARYSETFAAGAFARSLAQRGDVPCYFNGQIVGRTRDGSLQLREHAGGLVVELQPWRDAPAVEQLRAADRDGRIAGVRVGFRAIEDLWTSLATRHRTITEAALLALSIMLKPNRADAGSWLATRAEASAWRVVEADLEARTRELEDLEVEC